MTLPVAELKVDHDYQHQPYRDAIADLKKEFRPELSGFILVNIRDDGNMYIIDGATRHQVHVDLGLRWIHAEVKRGLSIEEEAQAYIIKAQNKQRQPVDWFHAGVIAKTPSCVMIHTILHEREIVVTSYASVRGGTPSKAMVSCVSHLQRMIRRDPSGDRLCEALDLILDTWGYAKAGLAGGFIETIYDLLAQYGEDINRQGFISKLGGYTITELQDMARTLRHATTPHISLRRAVQRKIIEIYNVGRNRGRIGGDA
jgi:hypothetical protein